jgi:hypothetical protein
MFSDLLLSSKSQRPRDKKQHCHLCYADVLLLKKDFEESIASVFMKKNGTFGTNEFLPKMSLNRCCVFIARIDLAKIMKLMLRVSSESKYFFFKRMVIQHIVENGCSHDQQKLNFFCPEVVKSEFDLLQNLGCKSCLRCESSSKAALKVFVRIGFFVADSTSGVIIRRSLLKVDERESGELYEELF